MAWFFGLLLGASFLSMPFIRPILARSFLAAGGLKAVAALSGVLTLYGAVMIVIALELFLALDGRRLWPPLTTGQAEGALLLVAGLYLFVLLLLSPLFYMGGAGRRAARRFAAERGLAFSEHGGPWPSRVYPEPWTLTSKVELPGGGFMATALVRSVGPGQSDEAGYSYWELGVSPAAGCRAEGEAWNRANVQRDPRFDEEVIDSAAGRFIVPGGAADEWRALFQRAHSADAGLAKQLVLVTCDGRRLEAALCHGLRSEQRLRAFERLLAAAVAGGMKGENSS
jgi:hypothetical protein